MFVIFLTPLDDKFHYSDETYDLKADYSLIKWLSLINFMLKLAERIKPFARSVVDQKNRISVEGPIKRTSVFNESFTNFSRVMSDALGRLKELRDKLEKYKKDYLIQQKIKEVIPCENHCVHTLSIRNLMFGHDVLTETVDNQPFMKHSQLIFHSNSKSDVSGRWKEGCDKLEKDKKGYLIQQEIKEVMPCKYFCIPDMCEAFANKDSMFVKICNILTKTMRNIGQPKTRTTCLILLLLSSTVASGKSTDRFVVREGTSFEIDCKHGLENIKVIRWEYVSNYNNKSEIIYDSQSNKTSKHGFEVSCQQQQQTFISTCNLIIIQTKILDSGKYVCYVGQGNETKLDAVVEIEVVVRGPKYKTMVVNSEEQVILPCEHNITNLTRARWSHVSMKGVETYQLYSMDWDKALYGGYEGHCEPHSLSCNLKILKANKESAGKYICMVGESQEFEDKYGLDPVTYFIEIHLVVGELKCNENMNKDLTLIGENDCYGIEADVLNLKCSFNYFGNINYNLLHLRWIEKYKFNSLEKKLNSSLINHEVKDETKKISIQTNLSVAYEMQNSIFQCILDDTLVKPCQLHQLRVQYISNTTVRSPSIYLNDLHNIKCSANKSKNVHCSYYWVHEIGGAMVLNPYAILPVENINSPGIYTCIAKCRLRKNRCIIKAMELEIIKGSADIPTATILLSVFLVLFVNNGLLSFWMMDCNYFLD